MGVLKMGLSARVERDYITREQAAAYISGRYFDIKPRTLAVYASDERGPVYRLFGAKAYYRKEDIDRWVESPEHYGNVQPRRPGALSAAGR